MDIIKHILGVYGLCNILCSTYGMNIPHTTSYTINTSPRVHIIHNHNTKRINLDGITSCSFKISTAQYKGIMLYSPIFLDGSMSKDEIIHAIKKAFGKNIGITISG